MVKIASYVFFDTETTGLPHEERNQTKIIEFSFVAVLRKDLEEATIGNRPYVSKLTFMLNPKRKIHPQAEIMTGITNDMLKNEPVFEEKSETILSFLKELPKPVCLVAHNGYNFDYKILLAEFVDINMLLPKDLLCVDSLVGFRRMHKEKYAILTANLNNSSFEDSKGSEDWPDLDISSEEWNDIDILCSSFSNIKPFETSQDNSQGALNNSFSSDKNEKNVGKENGKMSFKLTSLYKTLVNKEVFNAHRAEDDCMMLLDCVVATKEFLIWTDKYCKCIHDIKPLERY